MPAEARVAPWPGDRVSSTCTRAPLRASSCATVQPTIPAPMTMTDGDFTASAYDGDTILDGEALLDGEAILDGEAFLDGKNPVENCFPTGHVPLPDEEKFRVRN